VRTQIVPELEARGSPVLAVVHEDRLVGVLGTRAAPAPEVEDLLATAREAGLRFIIAAEDPDAFAGITRAEVVPDGSRLLATVRRLQGEGRVVAVVGTGAEVALEAADCGIAIRLPGSPPPVRCHLLCGDSL